MCRALSEAGRHRPKSPGEMMGTTATRGLNHCSRRHILAGQANRCGSLGSDTLLPPRETQTFRRRCLNRDTGREIDRMSAMRCRMASRWGPTLGARRSGSST